PPPLLSFPTRRSSDLTLDYSFDVSDQWRGRVGGGYRYTGKREGSLGGGGIPDYDAVDLHAELSNMTWTARLYVRNATDEMVYMRSEEHTSELQSRENL